MAYKELIIEIQQALHGYQNGHQLLACSRDLTLVAKKAILFQSDLSGSMVDSGFDTYFTGYPIKESNIYIFARTWYAPEMERPGCVWTHSLILEFTDIGKIPNLTYLNKFFLRPQSGQYSNYSIPLTIDISNQFTISDVENDYLIDHQRLVMSALYESPFKTIIIPSNSSSTYEIIILRIWSDQWPRLRRNFTFCSGALSLKTMDEREYDLQVTPIRRLSSLERQSNDSEVIGSQSDQLQKWIKIFYSYPTADIRKFFWSFGSDMEGERKNFIPLLYLFDALHSKDFSLSKINQYVNEYFPNNDQGKFLKKSLFGMKSILPVTEKEILSFLLTTNDYPSLNYKELELSQRINNLVNNNEFTSEEFIALLRNVKPHLFEWIKWEEIILPTEFILKLIEEESSILPILIKRWPEIATETSIWNLNFQIQKKIFYELLEFKNITWEPILEAVLSSKSEIIYDFRKNLGSDVTRFSLQWYSNKANCQILENWAKYITKDDEVFYDWIDQNKNKLTPTIFLLIFTYLSPKEIEYLKIDSKFMIKGYEDIKLIGTGDLINYISYKLLAVGFGNSVRSSYLLVERTFPIVYQEVCNNNIGESIWRVVPRESAIQDYDDFLNPLLLFKNWDKHNKIKFDVANWDIGRQLIIKTVNKYIQNSWPLQSFAAAFSGQREFKECISYCCTFKKGTEHIRKFIYEIDQEKIRLNPEQKGVLKKYFF